MKQNATFLVIIHCFFAHLFWNCRIESCTATMHGTSGTKVVGIKYRIIQKFSNENKGLGGPLLPLVTLATI